MIQVNQAACGEKGTETNSVHTLHGLLKVQPCQYQYPFQVVKHLNSPTRSVQSEE